MYACVSTVKMFTPTFAVTPTKPAPDACHQTEEALARDGLDGEAVELAERGEVARRDEPLLDACEACGAVAPTTMVLNWPMTALVVLSTTATPTPTPTPT